MKLHAKILPEYLDLILDGTKTIEIRELESITFTDGKREHTFEICDIDTQSPRLWADALPHLFSGDHPVVALHLDVEVDKT